MVHSADWLAILKELVAINTISSTDPRHDRGNRAAAEALANRLAPCGFDCTLLPTERANKVNLIARISGSADEAAERGLVFAGHLDTVPCDSEGWTSDPFQLVAHDDCLYGLGVADMKGFIALAAGVAAEYADYELTAPITLLASADEESSLAGALALQNADIPRPGRHCVVGEPTSLIPVRRHKGVCMESVIVHGESGHASNPGLGANAIDAMHVAIAAILRFRAVLIDRVSDQAFQVPHATLNLGSIQGGDNANRIASTCKLDIDIRPMPGMNVDELRNELRERVRDAISTTDCNVIFQSPVADMPAFETAANAPIVTACEEICGTEAGVVNFGTEGAIYNQMGIDSVILGPGDISQAHHVDESLALNRVVPMQQILRRLINRFCGTQKFG